MERPSRCSAKGLLSQLPQELFLLIDSYFPLVWIFAGTTLKCDTAIIHGLFQIFRLPRSAPDHNPRHVCMRLYVPALFPEAQARLSRIRRPPTGTSSETGSLTADRSASVHRPSKRCA